MSERPEWIKNYLITHMAHEIEDYITHLETSLAQAKADSERLDQLELALKEGDVCGVTAREGIAPGKYKYIEIDFVFDRNPVTTERLADAIDEALEEPEQED